MFTIALQEVNIFFRDFFFFETIRQMFYLNYYFPPSILEMLNYFLNYMYHHINLTYTFKEL